MFSRLRDFLNRHRRKFIVSGLVLGGVIVVSRYAQQKFREWQERETKEFLERTRRQQHFESTERTCNQTILSLAPKLMDVICKTINTEDLVSQLRSGDPKKHEIWQELKVLAFTKASVIVYAFAMLVVTLRVQLNLIGGYMFRELNENNIEKNTINSKTQEKYLSLIHYFLSDGVNDLVGLIQSKVLFVMGNISLKRRLNLNDTEQLFWALQAAICNDDNDPSKNIVKYVISHDSCKSPLSLNNELSVLNNMTLETVDVLESEEVACLVSSLVSQGFTNIIDRISEFFVPNDISRMSLNAPCTSTAEDFTVLKTLESSDKHISKELTNGHINGKGTFIHPNNLDMAMAKLIPIVNGLGHTSGHSSNDPWVQQLVFNDRIKMLGANVYEAFGFKNGNAK